MIMTLDDRIRSGNMSRRDFLNLAGKAGIASAGMAILGGCSSTTGPDPPPPPPPPTKYKHSVKAIVERTLHYGVPINGGFYDVTMLSNGKQFLNNLLGTVVNLDETTNREERCNIIVRVPGCLPSEFRNLPITNNDLEVKDVAYLGDFDIDYLLTEVLTYKVNGKSKNTSWINRTMNGSSNPDGPTGLRLDQPYLDYIINAFQDFINAGKRFKGSAFEEVYIQTFSFNPNGNHVVDPTVPPNGEFWVFRDTVRPGVGNVTYPLTEVRVDSSKMFVNQSSAVPMSAYHEAFDALIGGGQEIGNVQTHFLPCVPFLMWRPRDTNDYWIDSEKESREGVDSVSGTVLKSYAQQYIVLERAQYTNPLTPVSGDFVNNPGVGPGGIDYNVPLKKPHFAIGLPIRPEERAGRINPAGEIRR